jgi:hypothetical protein
MKFYNLKSRSHVEVPDSEVRKLKLERPTKSGVQIRYAFSAEHGGSKLFRFVSEKEYNASSAKEG